MDEKAKTTRPIKTALLIGFEKPVYRDSRTVAEFGAWCNRLCASTWMNGKAHWKFDKVSRDNFQLGQ